MAPTTRASTSAAKFVNTRRAIGLLILYFLAMAVAHFFDLKYPILFVYYDVFSTAYQNKIISFCVVTYALLYLAAYNQPAVVAPYAIASLFATLGGLSAVNLSGALAEHLNGQGTAAYWAQTAAIAAYAALLAAIYLAERPPARRP